MNEGRDKVDQILENLDIQSGSTESSSDSREEAETGTENRLARLHEAGAITDEEYEVLQSHLLNDDEQNGTASSGPTEFGQSLVTSEGSDMDFSIVGVFEGVDKSKLTNPAISNVDFIDEADIPIIKKVGRAGPWSAGKSTITATMKSG